MKTRDDESAAVVSLGAMYFFSMGSAYLFTVLPRTLEEWGWTGAMIGGLFTLRKFTEALFIGMWASAADSSGGGRALIRAQTAMGVAALLVLPWARSFPAVAISLVALSATMGCALPLVDALTLGRVGPGGYGSVRAWGTVGYGVIAGAASVAGLALDYAALAGLVPWAILVAVVGAALVAWSLPQADAPSRERPSLGESMRLLANPELVVLFLLGAMHWAAQAPFNLFWVALCEHRGVAAWVPGVGVVVGVACEVVILAASARVLARGAPAQWLVVVFVVSVFRW
ncbi:MAG: MFS transporter, partial [Myxococcota bacterium]